MGSAAENFRRFSTGICSRQNLLNIVLFLLDKFVVLICSKFWKLLVLYFMIDLHVLRFVVVFLNMIYSVLLFYGYGDVI